MNNYGYLKHEYPEYISKEQLYKICHMAKETAKYYLDAGLITCIASDKKTRRYRIHIDDVIAFLDKRDHGELPMRSRKKYLLPKNLKTPRTDPSKLIRYTAEFRNTTEQNINHMLRDYPDALTPRQMAEFVGLTQTVIQRYILYGHIMVAVVNNQYRIPHNGVIDFVLSGRYLDGRGCSERYSQIKGHLLTVAATMLQSKEAKNVRKHVQVMCVEGELANKVDSIRQHYLNELKGYPDLLTVRHLKTLFDKHNTYIQSLLQDKTIMSAKVNGAYVIPQKGVEEFLNSKTFNTMHTLLIHLYAKMNPQL